MSEKIQIIPMTIETLAEHIRSNVDYMRMVFDRASEEDPELFMGSESLATEFNADFRNPRGLMVRELSFAQVIGLLRMYRELEVESINTKGKKGRNPIVSKIFEAGELPAGWFGDEAVSIR